MVSKGYSPAGLKNIQRTECLTLRATTDNNNQGMSTRFQTQRSLPSVLRAFAKSVFPTHNCQSFSILITTFPTTCSFLF